MPVQRPLLWRQSVEARPHLLGDGGATVAKVTPEETPQTSLPESAPIAASPPILPEIVDSLSALVHLLGRGRAGDVG